MSDDKTDFLGLERVKLRNADPALIWQIALTSLTPGGSEYTEPARSTAFVREQFHHLHSLRVENHNLKKRIAELEIGRLFDKKNTENDGYSEARLAD